MKETANLYFQHWYLTKLRLLEQRRIMFSEENLFAFEYSCMQMRKTLEGVAQSWIIAAELQGLSISNDLKMAYKPKNIFNNLLNTRRFVFPAKCRLTKTNSNSEISAFILDMTSNGVEQARNIVAKYDAINDWLHSVTPFAFQPLPDQFGKIMRSNMRNLAHTQQRIWNDYWFHQIQINEEWFCINLGSDSDFRYPTVIRTDKLSNKIDPLPFNVAPKDICGTDEPAKWAELKQSLEFESF